MPAALLSVQFTDKELTLRKQARAAARRTLLDPAVRPWPWPSARLKPGCARPASWNASATPACGMLSPTASSEPAGRRSAAPASCVSGSRSSPQAC
jgi:hypothetical protein